MAKLMTNEIKLLAAPNAPRTRPTANNFLVRAESPQTNAAENKKEITQMTIKIRPANSVVIALVLKLGIFLAPFYFI